MSRLIDKEELKKIANLAALELGDKDLLTVKLEKALEFIDQIKIVDTQDIKPLSNSLLSTQRLRNDEITEIINRDDFLILAPASEQGFYLVPSVINSSIDDPSS